MGYKEDMAKRDAAEAERIRKLGQPVVITGVEISFKDMVRLILLFSFAAIPAVILLAFFWGVLAAMFGSCFRMG